MVSRSKVMNDLHPWHWTLLSLRNSTRYGRSQITKNVHHVMLQLHLYFTEMIWPLSKEHYSKLQITTFMAMTFKLFTVHVETYGFQHWTLHDLENDPKVKGHGTRSFKAEKYLLTIYFWNQETTIKRKYFQTRSDIFNQENTIYLSHCTIFQTRSDIFNDSGNAESP